MSCPDCFSGHVKEGNPVGKEETIHGRKTYVATPRGESKGTIVIVPDVFGWDFVNNRLLADHYAFKGDFTVLLPDFMDGGSAPPWLLDSIGRITSTEATVRNWIGKPYHLMFLLPAFVKFIAINPPSKGLPRVEKFLQDYKAEHPSVPIGVAGFCWGGWITFALSRAEKPLVDAHFSAHPSLLSLPKDAEGFNVPTSIAMGDKDMAMDLKAIQTMKDTFGKQNNLKWEVEVYEEAGHGFSLRADPGRDVNKQADKAEDQAVKWFTDYFASVKK